jgi:hypothetical protein
VRVVYVSYDGALDPLGASQVVPYLVGLAKSGISITLISFEKPRQIRQRSVVAGMAQRLSAQNIVWCPLGYHERPRIPATLWDVVIGSRTITREMRRTRTDIVHCRGDVSMFMARRAKTQQARLLYDVRGFFSDERVEVGSWRRGSLLDRLVRSAERGNLRAAHGLVCLTHTARKTLAARRQPFPPSRVIPTCADVEVFRPRDEGEAFSYGLVYSGSFGNWYMSEETMTFARVTSSILDARALFLTPQETLAHDAGATTDWADVMCVPSSDVPAWLRRGRALLFFLRPSASSAARFPTRLAEALASGLPIVVNRGIEHLDRFIERENIGVLVEGFSTMAYQDAAHRLRALLDDCDVPGRCRRFAEAHFSTRVGVAAYRDLYDELCVAQSEA